MNRRNSFIRAITSVLLILLIMFVVYECSSTGSNDSNGPGNSPANGSLFESGDINMGESFSHTFGSSDTTVAYFCRHHISENMKGKVVVKTGAAISGQDTVIMNNRQFNPSQITVAPNTKIVWVNQDNVANMPHTVTNGSSSSSAGGGGGPNY